MKPHLAIKISRKEKSLEKNFVQFFVTYLKSGSIVRIYISDWEYITTEISFCRICYIFLYVYTAYI